MGRFDDHHKQFSLLIKAFALLAKKFPDWNLTLCGDGYDRERYKQLVSSLNMQDRVLMPGMVEDVDTYYSASHLFCSPSLFEGYPQVILEAQCFALPTVGFSQCPGTNDIIVHGENGLLAEEMSAECLAHNLAILMADSSMRLHMSQQTQEMLDRHDEKTIHDQWEAMLVQTAGMKNKTRLQKILSGRDKENVDIVLLKSLLKRTPLFRKKPRMRKLRDSTIKIYKKIKHKLFQ